MEEQRLITGGETERGSEFFCGLCSKNFKKHLRILLRKFYLKKLCFFFFVYHLGSSNAFKKSVEIMNIEKFF